MNLFLMVTDQLDRLFNLNKARSFHFIRGKDVFPDRWYVPISGEDRSAALQAETAYGLSDGKVFLALEAGIWVGNNSMEVGMKKTLAMIIAAALFISACGGSTAPAAQPAEKPAETVEEAPAETEEEAEEPAAEEPSAEEPVAEEPAAEEPAAETAEIIDFPIPTSGGTGDGPVIGIAWRADPESEFYTNMYKAIEEAGGRWVMLDQVKTADLAYDEAGKLTEGVEEIGMLTADAAEKIKQNTWHGSNVEEAMKDVSFVIVTGGEDVSPNLFAVPEEWHHIEAEIDYNAERDVSDYLTLSYCLDNDIPCMGVCRGSQMLSVVSGAEVIQDIPVYFAEQNVEYKFEHRNEKATPESYRDYAPHEVTVEPGSILNQMTGKDTLTGCPSWHHQAVRSVSDPLAVTGYMDTNGIQIIEAVQRMDKTCAIGIQFHPEAAIVKRLEGVENADNYMDMETALSIFQWIVQEGYLAQDEAA